MLEPPLNPMLLTSKNKPFDSDEYLFEIKWDGYRCLCFIDNKNVMLQSRNKNNLSSYFPELADIYRFINTEKCILDGEICYIGKEGKPIFSRLQGRLRSKNPSNTKYPVVLIVWDILSFDNQDIYLKPLIERKKILNSIIYANNNLLISSYILSAGKKLYKKANSEGLEGIVAKKNDSPYEFNRSKYWYKIKCWKHLEVYIAGYSRNGNSLVVGRYREGQLTYMGKVKLALNNEMSEALFSFFPSIISKRCPFNTDPGLKDVYWLKPLIRTRVRYTELSRHNTFRHGFAIEIIFQEKG